jgi:hypothetical protein
VAEHSLGKGEVARSIRAMGTRFELIVAEIAGFLENLFKNKALDNKSVNHSVNVSKD